MTSQVIIHSCDLSKQVQHCGYIVLWHTKNLQLPFPKNNNTSSLSRNNHDNNGILDFHFSYSFTNSSPLSVVLITNKYIVCWHFDDTSPLDKLQSIQYKIISTRCQQIHGRSSKNHCYFQAGLEEVRTICFCSNHLH